MLPAHNADQRASIRKNKLRQIIKDGGNVIDGWCANPNAHATEIYAHSGWGSVTVDLQHGPVANREDALGRGSGAAPGPSELIHRHATSGTMWQDGETSVGSYRRFRGLTSCPCASWWSLRSNLRRQCTGSEPTQPANLGRCLRAQHNGAVFSLSGRRCLNFHRRLA